MDCEVLFGLGGVSFAGNIEGSDFTMFVMQDRPNNHPSDMNVIRERRKELSEAEKDALMLLFVRDSHK
jgi:hypothetical protein